MSRKENTIYKAILVDFFDTLVLRHVTAKDVLNRWAICLKKKFPDLCVITNHKLVALRLNLFKKMRSNLL